MSLLRVATLNLWHRSDPWRERLRAIRAEVSTLAPDILGVQEVLRAVDFTTRDDQAAEIAEGFGFHVAYAPACVWGGVTHFGNALLSRFPILESSYEALPGHTEEARSYVYALLDTPSGRTPVFVTHLAWRPEDFETRIRQVKFLKRRIDEIAPASAGSLPAILMGDLNAEPHSEEMLFLAEDWVDAWVAAGDGSEGHTWDRKNPYTHVHDVHSQRIDYIWVRSPLARVSVTKTRIAFCTPDGAVWPSDHFGLVAELAVH